MLNTLRCLSLAYILAVAHGAARDEIVIDKGSHHLGVAGKPEWKEFEGKTPEGPSLEIRFSSRANANEMTLLLRQRDVKRDWPVKINDQAIAKLVPMESALWYAARVPPGLLRDGQNLLKIGPASEPDDIVVDTIRLDTRPYDAAVGGATLEARVTDSESGRALPCRLTITDKDGALVPLRVDPKSRLAARTGVLYIADGKASLQLAPGSHRVYASRGFEYGVDRAELVLGKGETKRIDLKIKHEVPTPGLVACDTHVHTLTHSGHGDATVEERVVTIAGEGIELPVATDHEHFTDLGPAAELMGVREWFTPVIGDEITTRAGHFNAFPFAAKSKVPDNSITDWMALIRGLRVRQPAPFIILNHPRDLHANYRPLGADEFNPTTGAHKRYETLGVDGIEVINSGALQSDPWLPFRDWMALWNHGERITAVAASDSHDVPRFIVGQGRTYVACRDDDPAKIDVDEARASLRAGRASVSLGLLTLMSANERFTNGDLVTGVSDRVRLVVSVRGPSWVTADKLELYANGVKVREQAIEPNSMRIEKARVVWEFTPPNYDVSLVAIASGPGVTAPFWPIPRPYQPSSLDWKPVVLGATNPILIDGDGDGVWTSAWGYAFAAIKRVGTEPKALIPAIAQYGQATATQAAGLCVQFGRDLSSAEFRAALDSGPEHVRRGFAAYNASVSKSQEAVK
jgi:hypothetical protein